MDLVIALLPSLSFRIALRLWEYMRVEGLCRQSKKFIWRIYAAPEKM